MKDLGAFLKRTRIANGVKLTEAAEDLDLSLTELENIESGNVRAFKDVYDLKEYIKQYAKYLGLSSEKVTEAFDDFLFDHTSKISLDTIKNFNQHKSEKTEEKKIKSPYTKEYKRKSIALPAFFIGVIVVAIISIILYLIISSINKAPVITEELSPISREEIKYEFTY